MSLWVEPTARLPLRWGVYGVRLGCGGALILGGTIALAGADTFQLLILLVGTAACMTGWGILPADGWRRLISAVPATLCGWLLLGGPRFVGVLVIPYLCWLLVRHRPPVAWLTALLPVAAAVVIAQTVQEYRGMLVALGVELAVIVLAAAVARIVAGATARDGTPSHDPRSGGGDGRHTPGV